MNVNVGGFEWSVKDRDKSKQKLWKVLLPNKGFSSEQLSDQRLKGTRDQNEDQKRFIEKMTWILKLIGVGSVSTTNYSQVLKLSAFIRV